MFRDTSRALVIALGIHLLAAPAAAQDRVSILLKNNASVAGEFEDLNNGTVYVRVSMHDQRRIPLGDIVFIDLVNASPRATVDEATLARGPHHLFVFKDNRHEMGTLLNIEGGRGSSKPDEPRIVSFRVLRSNEERRVRFGELARIHLLDIAAPAPPKSGEAVSGAIVVRADAGWVATNVMIRRGDRVAFRTTGEVQLSADAGDRAGASGSVNGRMAPGAPVPTVPVGALIGRVGNGQPFAIGDQAQPLPLPGEGMLYLAVNDDTAGDNIGLFQVVIAPSR